MTMPVDNPPIRTLPRSQWFRPGEPPLALVRIESHQHCPIHQHEFSELVVVLRGTGVHMSPIGEWPITAGDVFVLHGDQAHGYRNTADLGLVNIMFSLDELALPQADVAALPGYHVLFDLEPRYRAPERFDSRLRLTPDSLHRVSRLIERLENELTGGEPGARFAALATFMLLIADLSRCYSRVDDGEAPPLLRLGAVVSHMERHYAEPLGLDDLAGVACLSRRSLTRAFRTAYGASPIDYLIRLRLGKALPLLADPERTITEIAHAVGFSDGNYFARRFRKEFGTSPGAYRETLPGVGEAA